MKHAGIAVLYCCIVASGCSDHGRDQKKADQATPPTVSVKKSQTMLMTGERDNFNPVNGIESIRKKKPTKFGRLTITPPVLTPDERAIQRELDKPNCFKLSVVYLYSKPVVVPSYPFDYENDIDTLKSLYRSHQLDKVVQSSMSKVQNLRALMKYTYTFMNGGVIPRPEEDEGPSAEVITRLRMEKGIGGTSRHYAALLCQLALSCGFNARLIGMHTISGTGEILSHDVCEVFLDDFEKWAVFDPFTYATYYERDSIPQSALEIREIMLNNNYKVLKPYSEILDFTDIVSIREKIIPRYRYLYIWRMNDILSKSPKGGSIPWEALYQYHLVWEDERTPVAEGGFDRLETFNSMKNPAYPLKGARFVVHEKSDFDWLLNKVHFNLERRAEDDVYLYLDSITPNFSMFEILDQVFKTQPGNVYKLNNYALEFKVRSINVFGMKGHSTNLQMTLQ